MQKDTSRQILYLAGAAGLLFTALLLLLAYNHILDKEHDVFTKQHVDVKEQILLKTRKGIEAADNVASVFKASDYVESEEFRIVVEDQLESVAVIQSVAFLPSVTSSDAWAFEKEMQNSGFVTYRIKPKADVGFEENYLPIKYIEPLSPINAIMLGNNLMADNEYSSHITMAIDSGNATASSTENSKEGDTVYRMFKPLYQGMSSRKPKRGPESISALIMVTVNVTRLIDSVTLPKELHVNWVVHDSIHKSNNGPALYAEGLQTNNDWLIFQTFLHNSNINAGGLESTLLFERHVYWQDIEYSLLILALLMGLILTTLMLITAKSIQLRDKELLERNLEIEKQVDEKTRELSHSESRLKEAQRLAHVGSWELDIKNNVLKWSDEVFHIFEIDMHKFGASYDAFLEAIHPDDRGKVNNAYTESLITKIPYEIEHRLLMPDGRIKFIHESCETFFDEQGEPLYSLGTVHDVSEQKKMEEQLRQPQKMEAVGTLVGGIAHDFNNTLAAIKGNLYLANAKINERSVLLTKLQNIEKLSDSAARMVRQLLTFARRDIVSTKPFSLTTFMKEEFSLSRSFIPENISYQISLCDEDLIIHGDATQLQQALINLLNNARDAVMPYRDQPKITLSLESFDANEIFQSKHPEMEELKFAHLMIADNGHGIARQQLTHIFEPFFTTKEVGQGTGLGLAMVYGSIQTHKGVIEVESAEGVGTTFHIYLPLVLEPVVISHDVDGEHLTSGEGETLLLVDDDDSIRETTKEVLEAKGYNIITASDGIEGLAIFISPETKIDAVISDVVMPNMGGIELSKKVHAVNKQTPVVLVTGYDESQTLMVEENTEHVKVLTKPFSFEELSQVLRSMLLTK